MTWCSVDSACSGIQRYVISQNSERFAIQERMRGKPARSSLVAREASQNCLVPAERLRGGIKKTRRHNGDTLRRVDRDVLKFRD